MIDQTCPLSYDEGIYCYRSRATIDDTNFMFAVRETGYFTYYLLSLTYTVDGQICNRTCFTINLNLDFTGSFFFWSYD